MVSSFFAYQYFANASPMAENITVIPELTIPAFQISAIQMHYHGRTNSTMQWLRYWCRRSIETQQHHK